MANYSLVLGVVKGAAEVIEKPLAGTGAKKLFKEAIANLGNINGTQYEEVWFCDTLQGRLRRKSFVCGSPQPTALAEPAKRRGRPPKAIV